MEAEEKDLLRREVNALVRGLAEERWRCAAGLAPAPQLVPVFREHGMAAHRETAARLRQAGEEDLAARVAALRAERAAAAEEEAWRAAEAAAAAAGPDGTLSLAGAERAVPREPDRDRRLALGRAAAAAAAAAAGAGEAAAEKRARARAEVGLVPDPSSVAQADEMLEASEDGYRDVLAWLARRELGLAPRPQGDLDRADLLRLLALPGGEGLFPAGMLAPVLGQALQRLGLDLERIRLAEGDRETQWPGAHAFESRVSFRRRGGAADWLGLFRAAGESLAAEATAPGARDPAFPAAMGSLLEGLCLEPRFLERELDVDRKLAPDLVRALSLGRLFALRARAAALGVAVDVERGLGGAAWREAHRQALSAAGLATWPDGLAARDADAQAQRRALSGAAQGEALRIRLVQAHDEDWWRNPRAAGTLSSLLAAGRCGPEDQEPSFGSAAAALVRRLEAGA